MSRYIPASPGKFTSLDEMTRFMYEELTRLSLVVEALDTPTLINMQKTTSVPTKPRDGDIRRADGTGWDPGSGKGLYTYSGSAAAWQILQTL